MAVSDGRQNNFGAAKRLNDFNSLFFVGIDVVMGTERNDFACNIITPCQRR
ncbi:hypothetical protein LNP24_11540 [Klebsiella pneumoniae subsp. pneumoniae]|nr:hypothetical protein [Klebsiella pneumoniae subsp. pneumoniae]